MDKELRIRYVLDKSQFDSGIKGANKDIQDTGKHLDAGTESALSFGKAAALAAVGAQTGMALVQQVMGAVSSSMQEAAAYTQRVAEAFGATRDSMREIAAIQGKGLTDDFVGSQLGIIKQAGTVDVAEGTAGLKAFQQFGSGYVGDGKDSRVSQDAVNRMLPTVMATAHRTGMGQAPAMQMFASIVQNMPKGTSEKDYMDTFAKMVAESLDSKGSASTTAKNVAPVLAEYAGEGGPFGESAEGLLTATRWVNTLSESNPAQAGMLARNVMKEFDADELKGKNDELGIEEGMTPDEKLVAMRDKYMAETGGKETFSMWYSKKVGRVGNMRSLRGMDVLIRKGLDGGFFDRMDKKGAGATAAGLAADNARYQAESGGVADVVRGQTSVEENEVGRDYASVQAMKAQARLELTKERAFTGDHVGANLASSLYGGARSGEESMVTERAMRNAQAAASAAGVNAYYGPDALIGGAMNAFNMTEPGMREEIKRLVELTAQANSQRSRQVPAVPQPLGGRPTVAAQAPR